jgi:hypothetical protein
MTLLFYSPPQPFWLNVDVGDAQHTPLVRALVVLDSLQEVSEAASTCTVVNGLLPGAQKRFRGWCWQKVSVVSALALIHSVCLAVCNDAWLYVCTRLERAGRCQACQASGHHATVVLERA